MKPPQIEKRLAVASLAVDAAAGAALEFANRRQQLTVRQKLPNEFVSEADLAVERIIRKEICSAFPNDQIVGEELGGQDCGAFWSVDPIDGTSNFLRGSPLWGISVAYVVEGQSEVGIIALPQLNLILAAQRKGPLTCNGTTLVGNPASEIAVVGVGENVYWPPEDIGSLEIHLRRNDCGVAGFRCATVGLAFAALGRTDGYIERRTNLWDIAAGRLLCEAAGLSVEDGSDVSEDSPSVWICAVTGRIQQIVELWWAAK